MKIVAFCPGHVTGFFIPKRHNDPLQSGSLGSGICIDKGAIATLDISEGRTGITAEVNGEPAPVTEAALKYILQDNPLEVAAEIDLQLPCGAGFGTSAAGSISAAVALCDALNLPSACAINAAHLAEIQYNTGLGDVPALSCGGVTFRIKEGAPPYGNIERIPGAPRITACVLGKTLDTADILTNADLNKRISLAGEACFSEMIKCPTLENLLRLSRKFTDDSRIASDEVKSALSALEEIPSSMIMLGNSVFALGTDAAEILSSFGEVFILDTDLQGPRILTRRE